MSKETNTPAEQQDIPPLNEDHVAHRHQSDEGTKQEAHEMNISRTSNTSQNMIRRMSQNMSSTVSCRHLIPSHFDSSLAGEISAVGKLFC